MCLYRLQTRKSSSQRRLLTSLLVYLQCAEYTLVRRATIDSPMSFAGDRGHWDEDVSGSETQGPTDARPRGISSSSPCGGAFSQIADCRKQRSNKPTGFMDIAGC